LLIGGTGFLGSFVAARLTDRPLSVLVRPTSDITVLPQAVDLREGDLDHPSLPLENVEAVVYCASMGFGHIPRLVRQLEDAHVRRAVFLSTTAIFTTLPSATRGVRTQAETAVQASNLHWTILRPTMIYGTARDRNISRLLRFLKRWPVFPVCGNALWQPIYVEDLADAVVAALDAPVTIGNAYNLAGAYPLPFDELIRAAARTIRRQIRLLPVPVSLGVLGAHLTHSRIVRPEQVRRLAEDKAFDYTDAARDFAFHPRSFAEGVRLEARSMRLLLLSG
jgi:nucleoside-diphosphate-sugar epimerase